MKPSIILYIILFFCSYNSLLGQDALQLKDADGNTVDFFLVSQDGKTVLKANNGLLEIILLEQHKGKRFTLNFDNYLAYLLYHNDLYFENGREIKDEHIEYTKIKYAQITNDEDGVFYVRRKEIRLD